MAFDAETYVVVPTPAENPDIATLRRARELLAQGWHKGGLYRRPSLFRGAAYCLVGAVETALYGRRPLFGCDDDGVDRLACLIKLPGDALDFGAWNDHRARRKDEVLAVFDAAIAKLGAEG